MSRRPKLILITICLATFLPLRSLKALLRLTINTSNVSIPFAITDYNLATGAAQRVLISAQTLTIRSTKNTWTLSVRALTSTFAFVPTLGDPNPNKPASDLSVRTPATSSTWLPLSSSNQILSTGPRMAKRQTRTLDYRLNSSLSTDPPGTYTVTIIYTLTTP